MCVCVCVWFVSVYFCLCSEEGRCCFAGSASCWHFASNKDEGDFSFFPFFSFYCRYSFFLIRLNIVYNLFLERKCGRAFASCHSGHDSPHIRQPNMLPFSTFITYTKFNPKARKKPKQALQFHDNGQLLLTGGLDKMLRLFQVSWNFFSQTRYPWKGSCGTL